MSDDLEQLSALVQEGDRNGVIAFVSNHRDSLRNIILSDPTVSIEQAKKDFQRERVLLNDVPFIPSRVHVYKNAAFTSTVSHLIDKLFLLGAQDSNEGHAAGAADVVLQRACRTGAGADSLFLVQKLFCIDGTFAKHCSEPNDPPIQVFVFSDAITGAVCAKSVVCNTFALHSMDNLEQLCGADGSGDPRPWVQIEAEVTDLSNLSTGDHERRLALVVSIPYGIQDYRLV
jgi:hypothetical protein